MKKKIAIFITTFLLVVNSLPILSASADVSAETEDYNPINAEMPISFTGTNSIGNLLTDAMTDELAEQKQNSGNVIYSVEVDGTDVYADISTSVSAKLVIGIYTEDQSRLISSVSQDVTPDDTDIYLTLPNEPPKHFYIKAYLIDGEDLSPVSAVYNGTLYTEEMQEFLSKTTEDFKEEKVVNFDEDSTNNFAVLSDDVTVIEENSDNNLITYANLETDLFTIENINDTVANLNAGDTFFGKHNGEMVIVKVGEISFNGTTATISGTETDLEDVFDYVKINTNCGITEGSIDESACGEGVTFEGYGQPVNTKGLKKAGDIGGQAGREAEFSFDFKSTDDGEHANESNPSATASLRVSGNGKLKVVFSTKLYISVKYKYLEVKLDYHFGGSISVTGKAEISVPLGFLRFDPVPGVCAEMIPSLVGNISAEFEGGFLLTGTVGCGWYSDVGYVNLTDSPKLEVEVKGEISIFIGLKIGPTLKILEGYLCEATLESNFGAEAKATLAVNTSEILSGNMQHDCNACIEGEIYGIFDLGINGKLLRKDKWKVEWTLAKIKIKVYDLYWSFDHGEGGLTTCPYKRYRLSVVTLDTNGEILPNVALSINVMQQSQGGRSKNNTHNIVSNDYGRAEVFLPDGNYEATANKMYYSLQNGTITIKGSAKSIVLSLEKARGVKSFGLGYSHSAAVMGNGDLYTWGWNYYGQLGDGTTIKAATPQKIMSGVDSVSLGDYHSAAITKNGDLYLWGMNNYGQLGDKTTNSKNAPVKILSEVESVSLGLYHSAAITKDGDLYLWGNNNYGQLGDGTKNNKSAPVKIMRNIASVSLGGYHSAAISKDGDLYTWGLNSDCQLGDCSITNHVSPIKIMSNVAMVSLGGSHSSAVTDNGDLYMWGLNYFGQLGIGTSDFKANPQKIMSDISSVGLGGNHSAAITKKGDLYLWGTNPFGQLGNGTTTNRNTPQKIAENVAAVVLGGTHSAAVTKNGDLYLWGENFYGEIGDGTYTNRDTPTLIMNINNDTSKKSLRKTAAYSKTQTSMVEEKTSVFNDLKGNTIYNFYLLRDKTSQNPLSSENILYLSQGISNADGNIEFSYSTLDDNGIIREEILNAEGFVVEYKNTLPDYLINELSLCISAGNKVFATLDYDSCIRAGFTHPYIKATIENKEYTISEYTIKNDLALFEMDLPEVEYNSIFSIKLYAEENGINYEGKSVRGVIKSISFAGASITLQNNLNVNYFVSKELFTSLEYSNPYISFEMNGYKSIVADYTEKGDYYVFTYKNIAPDKMNDIITATLHANFSGNECQSEPLNYSISQYCYSMLGKTDNSKLKTLLVDLLNYGSASQIYNKYKTNDLANKSLTYEQIALGTQGEIVLNSVADAKFETVVAPEVVWKGVSLNLKDSITMQFVFETEDLSGITIKIAKGNGNVLKQMTADDFIHYGNYYIADFNGYTAGQMDEPVFVTAYRNYLPISNTVEYSIESYAYAKQNDSNEDLVNLVKAMIKYGRSAEKYTN